MLPRLQIHRDDFSGAWTKHIGAAGFNKYSEIYPSPANRKLKVLCLKKISTTQKYSSD